MNMPDPPAKQIENPYASEEQFRSCGEFKDEPRVPSTVGIGVKVLFGVLIGWGLLIAIGSIQTQASTDFRRPLVVGLTMGAFLGVWALALRSRSRKDQE